MYPNQRRYMFLNPSFKMVTSFVNIARSTSKFMSSHPFTITFVPLVFSVFAFFDIVSLSCISFIISMLIIDIFYCLN